MISRLRALLLLLASCLTLAPPALAQKDAHSSIYVEQFAEEACRAQFETAKTDRMGDQTPLALLMEIGSLSHDCTITAFFALNLPTWQEPDRQAVYALKRWRQRMPSAAHVRFADSIRCEAVKAVVIALAEFQAPHIEVPGLKPLPESMTITADGYGYALWSDRLANGDRRVDTGEVTITANNNDALALLADKLRDLPIACWQTTEPVLL